MDSVTEAQLRKSFEGAIRRRGQCWAWDKPFVNVDAAIAYCKWRREWEAKYSLLGVPLSPQRREA